ncbi:MAG: SH3 domain-containing protein [Clostridiales bacterium]|nr:SH3 domain-containing protein [Clostridiales bacterium]
MRYVRKLLILLLTLTVVTSVFYIEAAADNNIAYGAVTVQASSLNIRSDPHTSSAIKATIDNGEIVVILEKTNSEWYRVNYRGTEGYIASMYLVNGLTAENFNATGKLTGDDVLFRSAPSTSGDRLGSCNCGTIVDIIGINNGWYKVKFGGDTGYIRSDYITIIADRAPDSAAIVAGAADVPGSKAPPLSNEQQSQRQMLINYALE